MRLVNRLAGAAALAATCFALGGCLIGARSSVDERGTPVDGTVLARIEPGQTTEDWVISALGAPTATTEVEDGSGTRILRYDHVVERKGSGHVFLLFAAGSESRRTSRTYFEVCDGVVTRHWSDAGA